MYMVNVTIILFYKNIYSEIENLKNNFIYKLITLYIN